MNGGRKAMLSMMEIQFAAGARQVLPLHELARPHTSWPEAKNAVDKLPTKPVQSKVASAHVMDGCGRSGTAQDGVARPDGLHW